MPDFGGPLGGRSGGDKPRIDFGLVHEVKNAPDAEDRVREYHYHVFDAAAGGAYQELKQAADDAAARFEEADKSLRDLQKRRRGLAEWTDAPASQGGEPNCDVPFGKWRFVDRLSASTALSGCVALLAMGVANVAANLLGSGNPVFTEQPMLAVLYGMVVPGAAIAAEGIHHFIHNPNTRRAYIFGVFGVGLAAAGLWMSEFAMQFNGVSATIDWGTLTEGAVASGHGGSRLVWSQVVAETALGAGLFMTADQVSRKYWRGTRVRTAEYVESEDAIARCSPEHRRLEAEKRETARAYAAIHAARERFVGQALAALSAIKQS